MSLAFFVIQQKQCIKVHITNTIFQDNTANLKQSRGNKYLKTLLSNGIPDLITCGYLHSMAPTVRSSFHKQVLPAPKHLQSNLTAKKISEITEQ